MLRYLLSASLFCCVSFSVLARNLSEITKSNELRFCYVPWMSAVASNDNSNNGVAYDLAPSLAKHLNVKANLIQINWDEQFINDAGKVDKEGSYTPKLFTTKKCDLYANPLTQYDWRIKKVDFVTVFLNRMVIVVRKNESNMYKKISDLGSKRSSVVSETGYLTWLEEQNKGELKNNPIKINAKKDVDWLKDILENKADFGVFDIDQGLASVKNNKTLTVVFPIGNIEQIGWAFDKADKDLQGSVQKFFDAQKTDSKSELNKLWLKYYDKTYTEMLALTTSVK